VFEQVYEQHLQHHDWAAARYPALSCGHHQLPLGGGPVNSVPVSSPGNVKKNFHACVKLICPARDGHCRSVRNQVEWKKCYGGKAALAVGELQEYALFLGPKIQDDQPQNQQINEENLEQL